MHFLGVAGMPRRVSTSCRYFEERRRDLSGSFVFSTVRACHCRSEVRKRKTMLNLLLERNFGVRSHSKISQSDEAFFYSCPDHPIR
jgi:heme/copper-type cytochrome/quinol oxidase subunit 1